MNKFLKSILLCLPALLLASCNEDTETGTNNIPKNIDPVFIEHKRPTNKEAFSILMQASLDSFFYAPTYDDLSDCYIKQVMDETTYSYTKDGETKTNEQTVSTHYQQVVETDIDNKTQRIEMNYPISGKSGYQEAFIFFRDSTFYELTKEIENGITTKTYKTDTVTEEQYEVYLMQTYALVKSGEAVMTMGFAMGYDTTEFYMDGSILTAVVDYTDGGSNIVGKVQAMWTSTRYSIIYDYCKIEETDTVYRKVTVKGFAFIDLQDENIAAHSLDGYTLSN